MLTDKEKMELLNLRWRVASQKEEIKRLTEEVKRLKRGADAAKELGVV